MSKQSRRKDDIRMTMTEARLNDLAYMLLQQLFFQPFLQAEPRECDVRICMDMAVPSRLTLKSAILRPDEVAGRSHDIVYEDVSFAHVFDVVLDYLEDHWLKEPFEHVSGDPAVRDKMWDFCQKGVFVITQTLPEARCAHSSPGPVE